MKMKRWVSFVLMFGMVMCLSAQGITLSGKVVDRDNKEPLANVIVTLKTVDSKAILQYSTTDDKGLFSLETSTMEKRMLTFSLMGYETVNLPLEVGKKEYRVSLKQKAVQIKEVMVKAPRGRVSTSFSVRLGAPVRKPRVKASNRSISSFILEASFSSSAAVAAPKRMESPKS